jgi:hypothetical protein
MDIRRIACTCLFSGVSEAARSIFGKPSGRRAKNSGSGEGYHSRELSSTDICMIECNNQPLGGLGIAESISEKAIECRPQTAAVAKKTILEHSTRWIYAWRNATTNSQASWVLLNRYLRRRVWTPARNGGGGEGDHSRALRSVDIRMIEGNYQFPHELGIPESISGG